MGGMWSGRNDYATTPTVEQCRTLDVNWMHQRGCLTPGASGSIRWTEGGERVASLSYRTTGGDSSNPRLVGDAPRRLHLSYTMQDHRTGESEKHKYPIPIETTPCNFGGERPWFRCPGVVNGVECNRRVGKLYRPPRGDLYLCRHCYDLGYRSSRESGDDMKKALRRFQRAQEKLGVGSSTPESGGYDDLYPDRPKGMHRSTYEELMNELNAAREEWYVEFNATFAAMNEHLAEFTERL